MEECRDGGTPRRRAGARTTRHGGPGRLHGSYPAGSSRSRSQLRCASRGFRQFCFDRAVVTLAECERGYKTEFKSLQKNSGWTRKRAHKMELALPWNFWDSLILGETLIFPQSEFPKKHKKSPGNFRKKKTRRRMNLQLQRKEVSRARRSGTSAREREGNQRGERRLRAG